MVQPYNSPDMASAWKNSFFSSERSDFYTLDNLPVAAHTYFMYTLIFSRQDIASEVCEIVKQFQRLAILFETHELCLVWVQVKTNASCWLLQVIQQRFGLSWRSAPPVEKYS